VGTVLRNWVALKRVQSASKCREQTIFAFFNCSRKVCNPIKSLFCRVYSMVALKGTSVIRSQPRFWHDSLVSADQIAPMSAYSSPTTSSYDRGWYPCSAFGAKPMAVSPEVTSTQPQQRRTVVCSILLQNVIWRYSRQPFL
jgi:hypothetical protein